MNNGELYKQAFGTLHAPDTVSLTAGKGAERKTFRPGRRLVLVCACTVLALGLAVTAYARGGLILGHVFGWGNNMEVTTGIDENGESYNEVRLHTENLTPPVVQRGGRMIFIVNNEAIKRSDGTWLGGCSVGVSLDADGRSSALWLESAKQELNIRW